MPLELRFLGAAGTVTGSKYLLESSGNRLLVDCGLFQGLKQLRVRNWSRFTVPPSSISAVVLSHAHIDHSGYLPALARDGFAGRIHCAAATAELCQVLLRDSAFLQEQDATYANRKGFSKHKPALPLYGIEDAERCLSQFSPLAFHAPRQLTQGLTVRLHRAGHMLGAAIVELQWNDTTIVFSGDLGRFSDAMMLDPETIRRADYLVVESTYGNRRHPNEDPQTALEEIVRRTVARGGTLIIPAFAVGRAQLLLYHLEQLKQKGRLADVPIYLNSPMAIDASEILCGHMADQKLSPQECRKACGVATYVRSAEESKALNENRHPKIIISASGMATGGRVLHHLKRFAPDPRSTILFAGFQAAGTRGAAMVAGTDSIKIHGEYVPVRAEIANLPMLSAHADADEIMRWLSGFASPPRMTFITHGEPVAADALRLRITDELGWPCKVPEHLETAGLT
jgi:metallo-beta-lactamase family protein